MSVDPSGHDRFVLRHRLTPHVRRYDLLLPDTDEAFWTVEQSSSLRTQLVFHGDPEHTQVVLRVTAGSAVDANVPYAVTDGADRPVGQVHKLFGASLLRSTYLVTDSRGTEFRAVESRRSAALLRRAAGMPVVGDVVGLFALPYDFTVRHGDDVVATTARRRRAWRATYDIDATADTGRTLDRRLLLAAAVTIDVLRGR